MRISQVQLDARDVPVGPLHPKMNLRMRNLLAHGCAMMYQDTMVRTQAEERSWGYDSCSAYLQHQVVDSCARPHFVPHAIREMHGGSALGPAVQDLLAASTGADTVAAAVPRTLAVCLSVAPCTKGSSHPESSKVVLSGESF